MREVEYGKAGLYEAGAGPDLQASLHAVGRRPRDFFPLPLHNNETFMPGSLSRKCARRVHRRLHVTDEVNYTLSALNSMFQAPSAGEDGLLGDDSFVGTSVAQREVQAFVKDAILMMGQPPALSCAGALRQLRVADGYMDDQTVGSVANYDPEKVSLPSDGWKPIPLAELWGRNGRGRVDNFVRDQLLPPDVAQELVAASGVKQLYFDRRLKQRKVYAQFLKRMASSNLVDFSLSPPREEVAIFFVTKKNNKLRMIIDARRSNSHFKPPSGVSLCTGESLGSIELGPDEQLTICQADLKDAFYHLELPEELRDVFGLPGVRAGDVNVTGIEGCAVKPDRLIFPRIAVVPMGWTHALFLCQSIHEELAEKSGLLESDRLRDRKRPPHSDSFHSQYVDNLIVMGSHEQQVRQRFEKAVAELKGAGLQVHEEETNVGDAVVLGWEYTRDGIFRPYRKRAWKARLAIRGLLRKGRAHGSAVERLLGHLTFISLCRREALSVFGEIYQFVKAHRYVKEEVPLPFAVPQELRNWDGILPLLFKDLKAGWSTQVSAVDASEFGLGMTVAECTHEEARLWGTCSERWRFREVAYARAREVAFNEDGGNSYQLPGLGYEDEDEVHGAEQAVSNPLGFVPIPFSAVDREWVTTGLHRWRRALTLPVAEARASLYAVKHILRGVHNFRRKHVILSDSMTATLAISRGRSKHFSLRRVCQQIGALSLASGALFVLRWIPSEWNPSDNPSRGTWQPSVPSLQQKDTSGRHVDEGTGDRREPELGQSEEPKGRKAKVGRPTRGSFAIHGPGPGGASQPEGEAGEAEVCPAEKDANHGRCQSTAAGLCLKAVSTALCSHRLQSSPVPPRAVHGQSRPGLCAVHDSRCPPLQAGATIASDADLASSKAGTGRLAKTLPTAESVALAFRGGDVDGAQRAGERRDCVRTLSAPHVCPLPQARGGSAAQEEGLSKAQQEAGPVPALERGLAPVRSGDHVKNPGVRRVPHVGPAVPAAVGTCVEPGIGVGAEEPFKPHLRYHRRAGWCTMRKP